MKHLPDCGNLLQQNALLRGLLFVWSARWCRGLMALLLLLLPGALLPLYAQPAVQWDKTLGGSGFDILNVLKQTSDKGYILGGSSNSDNSGDKTGPSRGDYDYWVVKLDSAGNKQWERTFGGDGTDQLYSLQQTSDGGYILGGESRSEISGERSVASRGSSDFWVIKIDEAGNKQWDKAFGGSNLDFLYSLQQTLDGGYILGGWSNSDVSGEKSEPRRGTCDLVGCSFDYWVVKLDAAGNKQWDKTIGGNDMDRLFSLQQTRDGGYILGGESFSGKDNDKTQASKGSADYWVVKLDADGYKQWDKTIGSGSRDELYSIGQTSEGGYILGGVSDAGVSGDKTEASLGDADFWVVKLDKAGKKQWDKTIGGGGRDLLRALQQTRDGGYILGGFSDSGISGDKTEAHKGAGDYWVVQLDKRGEKQWDKTIGGSDGDFLYTLQQTRDQGFVLGGTSQSSKSGDKTEDAKGNTDFWVVKLASFPEGGQVKSFTLINTQSEQPLRPLQDGDTINLFVLPTLKLNIRANTVPGQLGSVRFQLSGKQKRTHVENDKPYALFGDIRGDYNKWTPPTGNYILTATPYSKPNAKGKAGTPLTIRFTVINKKVPVQVESFTLIDAEHDQPIMQIGNEEEIDLAVLPSLKLNIEANTLPARVGSVRFQLRGKQKRTHVENDMPYALFGDTRGDYNKWTPPTGSYTLTATPYSKPNGKGKAGIPLTIRFRIEHLMVEGAGARMSQGVQAAQAALPPSLTLFPNPTPDGRIRLQITGQGQGQVHYSLLSSAGSQLAAGTVTLTTSSNLVEFDFSSQIQAGGVYFLRIDGANAHQVFRIIRR